MQIKKIKDKAVKKKLRKIIRKIGENAFPVFIVLVLLALVFGVATFYRYTVIIEKTKPKPPDKITSFNEEAYQSILKEWQTREKNFLEVDTKIYKNPFQGELPKELTEGQF